MFKRAVAYLLILGIFTSCVSVDPEGRGYSVTIPMAIVNSTLAQNFPVDRDLKYGVVSGKLNIQPNNLWAEWKDSWCWLSI